jgi:hypothetical protein
MRKIVMTRDTEFPVYILGLVIGVVIGAAATYLRLAGL